MESQRDERCGELLSSLKEPQNQSDAVVWQKCNDETRIDDLEEIYQHDGGER